MNPDAGVALRVLNIGKGEQRSAANPNPFKKVPFLAEADGFGVPESAAIMRYLCTTRAGAIADHWWPAAPRAAAAVDAALAWHASSLRPGSAAVVWHRAIARRLDQPSNEAVAAQYGEPTLAAAVATLDRVFLVDGRAWVAGGAAISAADLQIACDLEQLVLVGQEGALAGVPRVRAWLARVRAACAPHWDDLHAVLYKVAGRSKM